MAQIDRWMLGIGATAALVTAGYVAYPLTHTLAARHEAATHSARRPPDYAARPKVIEAFYDLMGAEKYHEAYAMLSASYRAAVSLAEFEASYRNIGHADVEIQDDSGTSKDVHVVSKTADRADPTRKRTFEVTYRLVWSGDRWLIDDKVSKVVSDSAAVARAEPEPASDDSSISTAPSSGDGPRNCRVPTKDEIFDRKPETISPNSRMARFYHRAIELDRATRRRISLAFKDQGENRADEAQALLEYGARACRIYEMGEMQSDPSEAQLMNIPGMDEDDVDTEFLLAIDEAAWAVEVRDVADPALVRHAYAAFEPFIPIASLTGTVQVVAWP